MSTTDAGQISVLLVGLPGFLEGVLRHELRDDHGFTVKRLTGEDATSLAIASDAIVVVGTDAASLRQATSLLQPNRRVLATIAVTGEQPIGDLYFVSPVGRNVSPAELAQTIRDVTTTGRLPIERRANAQAQTHAE